MIRQHQPGRVRRNTTATVPKSAAVATLLNKAILHDVFDIDDGDDSEDLVIIGENVSKNNKRKKIETIHRVLKASDNTICQLGVEKFRQINAIEFSNGSSLPSRNSFVVDGHGSNLSCDVGDDSEDLVMIREKVGKSNRRKTVEAIGQVVLGVEKFGQIEAVVSSNGSSLISRNSISVDGHGSVLSSDYGDVSEDLVIIGEKISKSNKGKTIEATHQIAEVSNSSFCQSGVESSGPVTGTETSNGYPLVSNELVNIDSHGSDLSYENGYSCKDLVIIGEIFCQSNKGKQIETLHQVVEVSDYTSCQPAVKSFGPVIVHDVIDIADDDDVDSDDLVIISEVSKSKKEKTIEAIHQAVEHLDNVDIPCGIEAPVTLLPESDLGSRKNTSESNSLHDTQSDATNSHVTTSSQTSQSLESNSKIDGLASNPHKPPTSTNFESATKAASICMSSSMNQVHLDNIDITGRTEAPFTLCSESDIGLRSTFESRTRYNTQSEATNSKAPTSTNFENAMKAASACNSSSMNWAQLDDMQPEASNSHSSTSSRSSRSLERENSKNQGSTMGSSILQNKRDNTYHSTRLPLSSPLFYQATPNKRKSTAPNPSTSTNFESAKKARLDNVDIPCGVAAPFTSFSESNLGSRQSTFISCTRYDTQSKATKSHSTPSYQASRSLEHDNSNNQGFTIGSSNLQSHSTSFLSSPPLFYQATPNKKKSTAPNPPSSATFESAKKARLDNVDIPRVVEETFTVLPESILSSRQSTFESSTRYGSHSKTTSSRLTTSSQSSRSLERDCSKIQGSIIGGSSLQNKVDITYHSTRINLSSPPPLVHQATPNKRKSVSPNPSTSANFGSAKKAHLDNVNIPCEIEAPFTSFPESNLDSRKSTIESSTRHGTKSKVANRYLTASSQPSRLLEPAHSKTLGSTMCSPTLQIEMDNDDHSFGIGLSASQLYSRAALSKEKSAAPQCTRSSNSKTFFNPFHAPTESVRFGSKNHGLPRNPEAMEPPTSTNFQRAKKSSKICTLSSMSQEQSLLFPQTFSCKKKTTSGKKATGNSSKESHATSSSKPSRSLGSGCTYSYGTGLSSPLLLTQAATSKNKSEAASSKQKSQAATSKKKSDPPKKLLQGTGFSSSLLLTQGTSSKLKSDTPKKLLLGTGLSSPLLLTQGAPTKKKSEASSSKKKSDPPKKLLQGTGSSSPLLTQGTSSKKKSDPPKKLLLGTGLSSPLLLTQGAPTKKKSEASSSKKKSDPPKKLLQATGLSSLLLTLGASSKKKSEASSSKKKSQAATSKKKTDPPKKLLQATGLSSPLLLTQGTTIKKKSEASSSNKKSQAASSKKKSASPKKLLQASRSSIAPKSKSCKQIAGITGSSQLSGSLLLSNSSATESSSVVGPSCLLLEYKWQVL